MTANLEIDDSQFQILVDQLVDYLDGGLDSATAIELCLLVGYPESLIDEAIDFVLGLEVYRAMLDASEDIFRDLLR